MAFKEKIKVVAFIGVKEHSQRLKGKNKKEFCGKPLFLWSVEQALQCKFIEEVIVATDDREVENIMTPYCKENHKLKIIILPKNLTQPNSLIENTILYCFRDYSADTIIILLQPTSPLRTIEDIKVCYNYFTQSKIENLVPAYRVDEFNFKLYGTIFICRLANLILNKRFIGNRRFLNVYLTPKERTSDIDIASDFEIVEGIMRKRLEEKGK